MKLRTYIQLIMLACFFLLPALLHAQGPGFEDDVPDEVPLDGGLTLLIAAGIGYAASKLKRTVTLRHSKREG
jgi:hypothetical protein